MSKEQGEQKVVLITGGSGGIGRVTACEFAKLGYKVVITGIEPEDKLLQILDLISSKSPNKCKDDYLALQANFDDLSQADSVVHGAVDKFSRLDVLINCASFSGKNHPIDHEDFFEDFQSVLRVNLMAATRVSQLALPHLAKTMGVIINISSIAGRWAMPRVSYSTSKAGLSMMTKALANAVEGRGVRVLAVAPGPVSTDFTKGLDAPGSATDLNRLGEVADLVVFLSSEKASFIHGSIIDIDGGCLTEFGGIFSQLRN